MNSFLVVVCFTLLISVAASAHINEKLGENNVIISSNIIQSAFPVPLDHFRPHDPRTFSMVNPKIFKNLKIFEADNTSIQQFYRRFIIETWTTINILVQFTFTSKTVATRRRNGSKKG